MVRIEDVKNYQAEKREEKQVLRNNLIGSCGEEVGNSIYEWIGGFEETPEARIEGRRFLAEALESLLKSPDFKIRQSGIELLLTAIDTKIERVLCQTAFRLQEPSCGGRVRDPELK